MLPGGRNSRAPLTHSRRSPMILIETIASALAITEKVSTMVLSETHAVAGGPDASSGHPEGTMVRRVPQRD